MVEFEKIAYHPNCVLSLEYWSDKIKWISGSSEQWAWTVLPIHTPSSFEKWKEKLLLACIYDLESWLRSSRLVLNVEFSSPSYHHTSLNQTEFKNSRTLANVKSCRAVSRTVVISFDCKNLAQKQDPTDFSKAGVDECLGVLQCCSCGSPCFRFIEQDS